MVSREWCVRMHWFSREDEDRIAWSIVGHALGIVGIIGHRFGLVWSILENFLSFGLSSGGSQAAHDWGFNYWRIPGSTWVRWATLIHGGSQAAPSYPGILTGRRTFENF
jgi:hypothetical protein